MFTHLCLSRFLLSFSFVADGRKPTSGRLWASFWASGSSSLATMPSFLERAFAISYFNIEVCFLFFPMLVRGNEHRVTLMEPSPVLALTLEAICLESVDGMHSRLRMLTLPPWLIWLVTGLHNLPPVSEDC